jgi:hypothetical protein
MGAMEELDAIKAIDEIMSAIEDKSIRNRILRWAWDKYSDLPSHEKPQVPSQEPKPKRKPSKRKSKAQPTKARLSIMKDLNLRPSNKKSFKDFAEEKKPTSNDMKSTVAVFYLRRYTGIQKISINHIYTCYKECKWRIPSDMANSIRQTSSRHGWIDPSDLDDIQLSTLGENLVEHDLPKEQPIVK